MKTSSIDQALLRTSIPNMSDFLLVKIIHLYTLRAFEVISPMSPWKTVIVKILLTPTSKHFCCQMYLHTLFVRDSSSILPVTFLPNNFFVLWLGRLVSFTLLSFLRPCPSYMIQCPPVSVCAGSHAPFLFYSSCERGAPVVIYWDDFSLSVCCVLQELSVCVTA